MCPGASGGAEVIDPRTVALRFSTLKLMGQSAAHYYAACQADTSSSPSQRIGSGAHAVLFEQPFAVYDGTVRRGKEWDAFELANADRPILNAKESEQAHRIAEALRADPLAAPLLFRPDVVHERRIDWTIGDRACRGTPDAYCADYVLDLKTTRCGQPERFVYDVKRYGYSSQLSWYQHGLAAAGIAEPRDCYIVAVESAAPYVVTTYHLPARAVALGWSQCMAWFEALRVCESSGVWPGYSQSVVELDAESDGYGLTIDGDEF